MKRSFTTPRLLTSVLVSTYILALLAGCGAPLPPNSPTPPESLEPLTPASTALPSPSATPKVDPPTQTPEPLAALVNGVPLTLSEYQDEVQRYAAAIGREPTSEEQRQVLDDLVDSLLLAQGALAGGFQLSPQELQARLDSLVNRLGGEAALQGWLDANLYTPEGFRLALERAALAAWMRDQVAGALPASAEQVHARQILLYNLENAQVVAAQLQAGADFENLASQYNALTGGDLGWFPRGVLPYPELEEAAFALEVGGVSPIIQTLAGFHILQLVERQAERPLDEASRQVLQAQRVQAWLEQQRSQGQIEILIP